MSSSGWNGRKRSTAVLLNWFLASSAVAVVTASSASADILVVSPHPDDDIITSAGVTYASLHGSTPVPVWVLYMTNGDSPGVTLGYQRQDEGAAAEALLGVDSAHLVFLGYPDGSLSEMRGSSYATTSSAFLSPNPGVGSTTNGSATFPPYGRISGTNGNNNAPNVRADLVHFINLRRPTDIYVTGRCDRHPDHAATYEYVIEAVQLVHNSSTSYDPIIHQTIVWAGFNAEDDWPLGTNPATVYTEPARIAECLSGNGLVWSARESLTVPSVMQTTDYSSNLKATAIGRHQTQGGFHAITSRDANDGHISAFVHRDEFFYPSRAPAGNPPPPPPPPVDAGPPPPVDAGTRPPVDAGTRPPVDAGVPPVDAGTRADASTSADAGGTKLDSGTVQVDGGAQLADAGATSDAASGQDAGVDAGVGTSADAMVADAASGTLGAPPPVDLAFAGSISAWPGDQGFEQDVDDVVGGDYGDPTPDANNDSGCSLATSQASSSCSSWAVLVGFSALLARRRRMRG